MHWARLARWIANIALLATVGWLALEGAWAQEGAAKAPAAAKAEAPGRRARAGQLPPYYREVVSEEQRQKIYAIQAEYNAQIAELEAKVAQLRKERDSKIEALLTPEQKKKIDDLRAAAKSKRDSRRPAKPKATGGPAASSQPAPAAPKP